MDFCHRMPDRFFLAQESNGLPSWAETQRR
jgi:hypothetical protein